MSEPKTAFPHCETCGAKLPAHTPLGLCPKCLLGGATGTGEPDEEDNGSASEWDPRDEIENYQITRQLGEGGFGIVYEAEQLAPVKRRVALKILKPGMDSRQILARFEAERQALALLEHPYIATVYDAGETARGRPYFAMELVDGTSITSHCKEHGLSLRQRLELFVRTCHGVQHAHQKGIIHRDLKPGNILVERAPVSRPEGTSTSSLRSLPRIIDFGIARATEQLLTEATLLTNAAQVLGTPGYMSPEQAAMNTEAIDTRSDVYSLGVLLYELLTGSVPFAQEALPDAPFDEILRRIREEDPQKPSARTRALPGPSRERIPPDLDWIALKALRKTPAERYHSVAELAADIERFLHDEPVSARSPSSFYLARKFVSRHKTGTAALLAAGLALLAGSVVSTLLFLRAEENADRAALSEQNKKTTFSRSDFLGSEMLLRNGQTAEAVAQLARAVRTDPANRAARFKLLSTLAYTNFLQPLHSPLEDDLDPYDIKVSPDDTMVVTAGETGIVRVRDLATGAIIRAFDLGRWATSATFHPTDRDVLLTSSHNQAAALWSISSGEKLREFRHQGRVVWAAFSPDAGHIVTHSADGTARVWDARSGAELHVMNHRGRDGFVAAMSPDGKSLVLSTGTAAQIWSLETFQQIGPDLQHTSSIFSIAIHPRGLVATGSLDSTARVWDLATAEPVTKPFHHSSQVYSVAFSPDGSQLATTTLRPEDSARLWDIELEQSILPVMNHNHSVYGSLFTPDGMRLITISATEHPSDAAIQIWNPFAAEPISAPVHLSRGARKAVLTNDGNRLITTSRDGLLRIWDIRTRSAQPLDLFQRDRIWHSTFSPDGKTVGVWTKGGNAEVWDAASGGRLPDSPEARVLAAAGWRSQNLASGHVALGRHDLKLAEMLPPAFHRGGLVSFAFTADGRTVLTGAADGWLRWWDHANARPLPPAADLGAPVTAVVANLDGTVVAAGTGGRSTASGAIHWFRADGESLGSFPGPGSPVTDLALADSGGELLAAGHADGTVRLLSLADGTETRFAVHQGRIDSLTFSPDQRWLASGSADNTAIIWEVKTRKMHRHLRGHVDRATHGLYVAFSSDSKLLITTASQDTTTRAWEVLSGRQISPPMQIASAAKDFAIGPGGIIGVGDPLWLWDAHTGESLTPRFTLHMPLSSICFSPDGRKLLAGGRYGLAQVYDLPPLEAELPEWFLLFAEAYAGVRYGSDGLPRKVDAGELHRRSREVLARDPDDPLTHWARWLASEPTPDKTIAPWTEATRRDLTERLADRGWATTVTRALFLTPGHPLAMAKLGALYGDPSQPSSARHRAKFYSRRAVDRSPADPNLWRLRVQTLARMDRPGEVARAYEGLERATLAALAEAPDDAERWRAYAQVLHEAGFRFSAVEVMAEAERRAAAGSDLQQRIQATRGRWHAALSPGEQALVSADPDAAGGMGPVLVQLRREALTGDPAEALRKIRDLLREEAGLSHASEWAAFVHQAIAHRRHEAGMKKEALQHFRAAILCYTTGRGSPPGRRVAHALATLEQELGDRPPAAELISDGASWSYHEGGTRVDRRWRDTDYDHSDWKSGPAPLGYGNEAPKTTLSYGSDPATKIITTYYRHEFELTAELAGQNALAEFQFDDGIRVYLNGKEAFRRNLPPGTVSSTTTASSTANKLQWNRALISSSLLKPGRNVIAVEVHQANRSSSDIWMNLRLSTGTPELFSEASRIDLDSLENFLDWPPDLLARSRALGLLHREGPRAALALVDYALAESPDSPALLILKSELEAMGYQQAAATVRALREWAAQTAARLSRRARRWFEFLRDER